MPSLRMRPPNASSRNEGRETVHVVERNRYPRVVRQGGEQPFLAESGCVIFAVGRIAAGRIRGKLLAIEIVTLFMRAPRPLDQRCVCDG